MSWVVSLFLALLTLGTMSVVCPPARVPQVRGTSQFTRPLRLLRPLTSPDVGTHCAGGLSSADLTRFFSRPIGRFEGGDYQRAIRLPDDRVLWTFQDALIGGRLVHTAALLQSGRCFRLLNDDNTEWLFPNRTVARTRWHWILGGEVGRNGARIHLFVVRMVETGGRYLAAPRPRALHRVVLDSVSLDVVKKVRHPKTGLDLYGWSVTSDARHTYLYSHCHRQFGFDAFLGFHPCTRHVKLARVPRGRLWRAPRYWTGSGWSKDHRLAVPVVDEMFAICGINPAQFVFTGRRFMLIEKTADWWGRTVAVGVSLEPQGPFRHVVSIDEPRRCEEECTYFASWVPWRHDGCYLWAISHNRWDTSSIGGPARYRPTFHDFAC